MFRELYAVARHTPMTLIVTPHGDQLKVIVIPKPGDDAPKESVLHKPLSFLGTPEELDTFSAEAIEQIGAYAAGANALREKLDLPTDAIAAEAEKENKPARSSTPAPAARAKKKAKPAKPVAAKVAPKKPLNKPTPQRSEAAPGSTGNSTGASSPAQDGAKPSSPAASTPTAQSSDHPTASNGKPPRHPDLPPRLPKIDRASKEQCIEDGRAYLVAIGAAKPSRELFCRWALTGRRYEKLWSNFAAFLAEVRGETSNTDQREPAAQELPAKASTEDAAHREGTAHSQGKPDEPAPGASRPTAATSETDAQQPVQTGSHPTGHKSKYLPEPSKIQWPFPVAKEDDWKVVAPQHKPTRTIRNIVTDTGIVLSATALTYGIGDKYSHVEFGDYRVIATEPARYIVTAWTDEIIGTKPTNNGDLLEGLASTQGA